MDDVDRATEMAEKNEAKLTKERVKMREARRTSLVEDCEDCGLKIPEDRLKAMPGTTLCVFCKEIIENNTKQ